MIAKLNNQTPTDKADLYGTWKKSATGTLEVTESTQGGGSDWQLFNGRYALKQ
jgi:hypothetical protein